MSNRHTVLSMTLGAAALVSVSVLGAYAQLQTNEQQKCLNAVNKDGAAVAKTQGKEHLGCVKAAGKGKLGGTAQACVTADAKGKVAKAQSKTSADAAKSCGTAPGFGFTSAAIVNAAARQADVDLVADLYGAEAPGDRVLIPCANSKAGCACQQKVSNAVEKLAALEFATFVGCKKATLKTGATSAAALAACVDDAGKASSIAADSKAKMAKAVAGITSVVLKSCDGPNVTTDAFRGRCHGLVGSDLGTCLDRRVECRVCTAINAMDGLAVNCDLFDDGAPNGSCASGAGPTPTATATFTPAPTPTFTPAPGETSTPVPSATATPGSGGTVLKGSLTATAGRFNYNLAIGLPAANAACSSTFAGTHACSYQELQTAAAAGDLVGLKDTGNNTVTAFWAIDSTAAALQQCQDDTPGTGSLLNWEYPTAHTSSRGEKVPLTNATGALGALQTSLQCNFSTAWVGCCQ